MAALQASRVTFALFLFVVVGSVAPADEPVPLAVVARELDLVVEWESFRNVATLRRGLDTLSFKLGADLYVSGQGIGLEAPPAFRRDGAVYVPFETLGVIRDTFAGGRATAPRIQAIFIDPGHGGKDPGAVGDHGDFVVYEKDVVLSVSLELARLLRDRFPEKEIVLSRDSDYFLDLEERTEIANELKNRVDGNIIYTSIHANAAFNNSADGFEVWILPSDVDRSVLEDEEVAEAEESVLPILNVMRQEEYLIDSELLGRSILDSVDTELAGATPNRGIRYESWAVVRHARMAAALVEVGFVTNKGEAELLTQEDYLARIGRGIYNGVLKHIERYEGATNGAFASD